jgi:alpha-tubulin suppressor-like RCC1 family protein
LDPTGIVAVELDGRATPCQQVLAGFEFTVAMTRFGELYSWGRNTEGELGLGHTRDESTPRNLESDDGAPDPVV